MESAKPKTELLVIVGPTASGKSELALKIAKKFNGEIIAADSRTIYKDMDIGTAKPSLEERTLVPHWGLDLVEPGESFSAGKFKDYAAKKIEEVQRRGKLPILVGGSGLYIDSLLFDFSFIKTSRLRRLIYSSWPTAELQKLISRRGWPMPKNLHNKRHLVGVIERKGQSGSRQASLSKSTLLIGLMPPDDVLRQRIESRAEEMFKAGIVAETQGLLKKYGQRKLKRTNGIAYRFSKKVVEGKITENQAMDLFKKADWQYARRQKTWFRRNKFIQWYEDGETAFTSVNQLLNK